MQILICILFFISSVYARPADNDSELPMEDRVYNQKMVTDLKNILQDSGIDSVEKVKAFNQTLDSLRGNYKESFIKIVDDVKKSIEKLNGKTKEAAQSFFDFFKEGGLFENRDIVREYIAKALKDLTTDEKDILNRLAEDFEVKFSKEFRNLKPADSSEIVSESEESEDKVNNANLKEVTNDLGKDMIEVTKPDEMIDNNEIKQEIQKDTNEPKVEEEEAIKPEEKN